MKSLQGHTEELGRARRVEIDELKTKDRHRRESKEVHEKAIQELKRLELIA